MEKKSSKINPEVDNLCANGNFTKLSKHSNRWRRRTREATTKMKLSINSKKYGLVKKKGGGGPQASTRQPATSSYQQKKKPTLFAADDSDDDDDGRQGNSGDIRAQVNRSIKSQAEKAEQAAPIKRLRDEALDLDSTIFDYDNWRGKTDEERRKQEAMKKEQEVKKPRYIQNLMKQAEKRQLEQEELRERKILREQEEEAANGETEQFITAAYKKKLEERERIREQERLEEEKEAREDVTKTQDFSGFYRNILASTVGGAGKGEHLDSGDTIDPERLPESQASALKEYQEQQAKQDTSGVTETKLSPTTVGAPALAVHAEEEITVPEEERHDTGGTTEEEGRIETTAECSASKDTDTIEYTNKLEEPEVKIIQKLTGSKYTGQIERHNPNEDADVSVARKTQETEIEAARRRALERRKKPQS